MSEVISRLEPAQATSTDRLIINRLAEHMTKGFLAPFDEALFINRIDQEVVVKAAAMSVFELSKVVADGGSQFKLDFEAAMLKLKNGQEL